MSGYFEWIVLLETGTAYTSRVPVFTPGVWYGPCYSSFIVLCVVVCVVISFFFCLYVASVCGLSILDSAFDFH